MANVITCFRILISVLLLFFPPLSWVFYVLYITAGVTDMADGAVARKTGTVSEFGSKLDSAADLVFVSACLITLIPILRLPIWLYIWVVVIAVIREINLISALVMKKEEVFLHTPMNKATGTLLFLLPLTLWASDIAIGGAFVCAAATFAAIQEGHLIRTGKKDPSDRWLV